MTKMCYGYATWTGAFINIVEDVNDKFKFTIENDGEYDAYDLRIPTGRYSAQTFTEALARQQNDDIPIAFDVSLDLDTGKVILGWDFEDWGQPNDELSVLWEEDTMWHELGFEVKSIAPSGKTELVGSFTAPNPPANLNISGVVYNADRNNGVCDTFLGWGTRKFQGKKFGTFWVPEATNKIALPPTPTPTP